MAKNKTNNSLTETTNTKTEYEKAKKIVNDKKDFYIHLLIYISVNIGLFLINAFTVGFSNNIWWSFIPAFFWGIGLLIHFLSIFVLSNLFGSDWEAKEIEKILSKNK